MANDIISATSEPLTMSSLEIADLVESRHDKVKQSIERLATRGVIVQPPLGDVPSIDAMGRPRVTQVYHLEKRDSFVVVAQLSPEFTARLVDRWQQLEEEKRNGGFALPQTYEEALEAHLAAVRQNNALIAQNREKAAMIEEMQPKVQAHDRLAAADGSVCITDAAKALQMRPKDLFSWLRQNGWIYRRLGGGHDLGYQSKTASGLLEHKVTTVLRADGSEKITEQVRITPKGLSTLAKVIHPTASLVNRRGAG